MDQFGPLPVTLAALEIRLRRGETLSIEGKSADGFTYTVSFESDRFLLRQGSTVHPFRQVEPALLTLVCCLGEFQVPEPSVSQEAAASASAREGAQSIDERVDQRLRTIFARVAQIEEWQVRFESTFEDLGIEGLSGGLDLLEIVADIQDAFHVTISDQELEQLETVGAYQQFLKSKGAL